MRAFKGLLFLFAIISLVAITQASVPLHEGKSNADKVGVKAKRSQNVWGNYRKMSRENTTSLLKKPSSFVTMARSTELSVSLSYYPGATSCSQETPYTYSGSLTESTLDSYSVYDIFLELGRVLPTEFQNFYFDATGCGSSLSLQLCYNSNCENVPLGECLDINQKIVKIDPNYQPYSDVSGMVYIQMSGACSSSSSGVSCFTADSKLILDNFQQIQMSSVQIGQQIMTYDTKTHQTKPTKVIGWLDRRDDIAVSYLEITHELGKLKVSPYHLLGRIDPDQHITHVFATDIKKGDKFLFHNTSDTMPSQVTHIRQVNEVGAFAPLTSEGTYLVNGVFVSCYAHFASHNMAHVAFAPYRWYYLLTGNLINPQTDSYIQILKATLQWSRHFRLVSNGIVTSK